MASLPRRTSRRTIALTIVSITLSIFVGIALLGWLAGWHTLDQYSAALRIAGVIAVLIGALSLFGNHGWSASGSEGAAALELAHLRSRGQPDYNADQQRSFTWLLVMAAVGLLVGGSGLLLPLLVR